MITRVPNHFRVYNMICWFWVGPQLRNWLEKLSCNVKTGVCEVTAISKEKHSIKAGIWGGQQNHRCLKMVLHLCTAGIWWRDKISISCWGVSSVPSCSGPGDPISTGPELNGQEERCPRNRAAEWPQSSPSQASS